MLDKDKILKNATKYFETGIKNGFITDELITFLGEDFVKAPASTQIDYHYCYEGGLIDMCLKITKNAISINEILPENLKINKESLIKVCLLHQIGKAHLFKPLESKWHNEKGIMYEFNEGLTSMSVGERSIFYLLSYGIKLSEEEFQAIINHSKDNSDKQAKYFSSTLSIILKQAIELTILGNNVK